MDWNYSTWKSDKVGGLLFNLMWQVQMQHLLNLIWINVDQTVCLISENCSFVMGDNDKNGSTLIQRSTFQIDMWVNPHQKARLTKVYIWICFTSALPMGFPLTLVHTLSQRSSRMNINEGSPMLKCSNRTFPSDIRPVAMEWTTFPS